MFVVLLACLEPRRDKSMYTAPHKACVYARALKREFRHAHVRVDVQMGPCRVLDLEIRAAIAAMILDLLCCID